LGQNRGGKMKKGFTLIELIVVVLIIGILTSIGVPYYYKTVETSKATDAVAIANLIANGNRMFMVDNGFLSSGGPITNFCNNVTNCAGTANTSPCKLIACKYINTHPWDSSDYQFFVCNGPQGGGYCTFGSVASAMRRQTNCRTPYCSWGYRIDTSGNCTPVNGAPPCPRM